MSEREEEKTTAAVEQRDRPTRIPRGALERLGKWGMYEFLEPEVRRLVAEQLGVGLDDLHSEVSLREDFAVDSLDLVELAMVLEGEFAIVLSDRILSEVRTYSDLVHATGLLIRTRRETEEREAGPPPRMRVRIVPARGESSGRFERTGWLTPYTVETIAEDVLQAGRGARLEMTIAAATTADLARVRQQFAWLGARGVHVTIQGDDQPPAPPVPATADADNVPELPVSTAIVPDGIPPTWLEAEYYTRPRAGRAFDKAGSTIRPTPGERGELAAP